MRFELLPPVPTINLVRRLRAIPLFRFASVDELFRISTIARQVRYLERAIVQERGGPADYIQVLLEGRFRVDPSDGQAVLAPPAMLGFQEVLKGTALQQDATAETEAVALVMGAEEFRTLLAANIELAQGLFRMLLSPGANGDGAEIAAAAPPHDSENRDRPLKTVEKAMILQTIPIFSHATAEEIYQVAAIAKELSVDRGASLFSPGSPASILMLLAGEIETTGPSGGTDRIEPGRCLGARETFAAANWEKSATAVTPGRMLQIDREALFDVLSDRMDLLQGIFSAIFHRGGDPTVGAL